MAETRRSCQAVALPRAKPDTGRVAHHNPAPFIALAVLWAIGGLSMLFWLTYLMAQLEQMEREQQRTFRRTLEIAEDIAPAEAIAEAVARHPDLADILDAAQVDAAAVSPTGQALMRRNRKGVLAVGGVQPPPSVVAVAVG